MSESSNALYLKEEARRPFRGRSSFQAGFTLLEATITIMIASLVVGACLPAFINWNSERKLRGPANQLAELIQHARTDAVVNGVSKCVAIRNESFAYGSELVTLPTGIRIRAQGPATKELAAVGTNAGLIIQPTGVCDAWRVEFSLADGSHVRMAVDPLTGFLTEEASLIR